MRRNILVTLIIGLGGVALRLWACAKGYELVRQRVGLRKSDGSRGRVDLRTRAVTYIVKSTYDLV